MSQKVGETSNNANHTHSFVVHADNTVTILEAVHPDEPMIKHTHQYIGKYPNGRVTSVASGCWPNCERTYGVRGAPPHIHELGVTRSSNVATTKINNSTALRRYRNRYGMDSRRRRNRPNRRNRNNRGMTSRRNRGGRY